MGLGSPHGGVGVALGSDVAVTVGMGDFFYYYYNNFNERY
jgi:hypothetical protein